MALPPVPGLKSDAVRVVPPIRSRDIQCKTALTIESYTDCVMGKSLESVELPDSWVSQN